jgi:hypothetical protein
MQQKVKAVRFRNVASKERNMKLGEIKAQALMLMGIGGSLNISYEDIATYKNASSYAPYIHAMSGAIKRCLSRFYTVGAIEKEYEVDATTAENTEIDIPTALASIIPLYVVGDVFAMEEPSVAQNKRNEFEMLLDDYLKKRAFQQSEEIEVIYGV